MSEVWKTISELDGRYAISNYGRIRTMKTGKLRKLVNWGSGYYYVHLRDSKGEDYLVPIHRLVARHFVSNPDDLPQVNHIDGDKHNNHSDNLEWVSALGNTKHAIESGLFPDRSKAVMKVSVSGETQSFSSIKSASVETGINYDNIRAAIRRGGKAGGYYWIFDTEGVENNGQWEQTHLDI